MYKNFLSRKLYINIVTYELLYVVMMGHNSILNSD